MSHLDRITHKAEGQTTRIRGVLLDENEQPLGALQTMVLTLYDKITGAIINSRDHQNILNVNGGTLLSTPDANGDNWFLVLGTLDMPVLHPDLSVEIHVALVQFTFGASKSGLHEIEIPILNVVKVP